MKIKHFHASNSLVFGRFDASEAAEAFYFMGDHELSNPILSVVYEDGTVMKLQILQITPPPSLSRDVS